MKIHFAGAGQILIPGLVILLSHFACAKDFDNFDADLAKRPQLSPAECAKQSPEDMYARLEAQYNKLPSGNPQRLNGIFSQAGEDRFFSTYAHQLQTKTDAEYPKLKSVRGPLMESFELCLEYLLKVLHSNIGHERWREPARLEWMLYHGSHSGFVNYGEDTFMSQPRYRPEQIEQNALAIGLANTNPQAGPFDKEMRPTLRKSISRLAEAEAHMTPEQVIFFRRRLVLLLGQFM